MRLEILDFANRGSYYNDIDFISIITFCSKMGYEIIWSDSTNPKAFIELHPTAALFFKLAFV